MKETYSEIEEMEAGPKIDELVAKHVMGWKKNKYNWWVTPELDEKEYIHAAPDGNNFIDWHPSTEIKDAWLVVTELSRRGWYFIIQTSNPFDVTFHTVIRDSRHGTFSPEGTEDLSIVECGFSESAPLAICRAALMAIKTLEEKGGK